jgi:hypothetical protein
MLAARKDGSKRTNASIREDNAPKAFEARTVQRTLFAPDNFVTVVKNHKHPK